MNRTFPYLLLMTLGLLFFSPPASADTSPATTEPRDAKEAATRRSDVDPQVEAKYLALVATLPPEEQAWERTLQQNLGPFYLPRHEKARVAGRSTAWDFVRDDPKLPRVLLIGDSVSGGYTLPVRKALAGKANVHRAPENCGPTTNGIKKLDLWLGDGRWDVIHFNFGIHDHKTPVDEYAKRLETIVDRLEKTGATLVWASTTPIPRDDAKGDSAQSVIDRNAAAAEIMRRHHIAVDDLFDFISPQIGTTQNPHDVHFNPHGYELLGEHVAESIEAALKARASDHP